MALRQHDQTKNFHIEETQSSVLAFETLSPQHKHLTIYSEHMAVIAKGATGQNELGPYFKKRSRSMRPSSTVRNVGRAVHTVQAVFDFFNSTCSSPCDQFHNEILKTCGGPFKLFTPFLSFLNQ